MAGLRALALALLVAAAAGAVESTRRGACAAIMLSGQQAHQPQVLAMGLYHLVPHSLHANKPVYRFGARYLRFLPASAIGQHESGRWCVSTSLAAKAAVACDVYMRGGAATPLTTRRSGTWHVRVAQGVKEDVGRYVVALNVRAECAGFAPPLPVVGSKAARALRLPSVVGASVGSAFGDDAGEAPTGKGGVSRGAVIGVSCAAAAFVVASWVSLAGQIAAVGELADVAVYGGDDTGEHAVLVNGLN
jgi:hypothetical protein